MSWNDFTDHGLNKRVNNLFQKGTISGDEQSHNKVPFPTNPDSSQPYKQMGDVSFGDFGMYVKNNAWKFTKNSEMR